MTIGRMLRTGTGPVAYPGVNVLKKPSASHARLSLEDEMSASKRRESGKEAC